MIPDGSRVIIIPSEVNLHLDRLVVAVIWIKEYKSILESVF